MTTQNSLPRSAELLAAPSPVPSETAPLTHTQRAMWFLERLAPESTPYNVVAAWRVRSRLDIEALRASFVALVDRHTILRTNYPAPGGEPVQRVALHGDFDFRIVDASGWSDERLRRDLGRDGYRPFDLEQGPVLRVTLLMRGVRTPVLLLALHHIAIDGAGLEILMKELGELYSALSKGRRVRYHQPRTTFAEHARHEAKRLAGPEGDRLFNFWQKRLRSKPEALELPTDHHRPATQRFRGNACSARLGSGSAVRARELARRQHASLFRTVVAAFQALLFRYTGADRLAIGTMAGCRDRPETQGLVGCLTNAVVLLADGAGDPTFTALLAATQAEVKDAIEHQHYPFPLLVEHLLSTRDSRRSPFFQTMLLTPRDRLQPPGGLFAFTAGEGGVPLTLGDLELESVAIRKQTAQFDLTLFVLERDGELIVSAEYNRDLFEPITLHRLLTHFRNLLSGAIAQPDKRLSELPLLSRQERRQLILDPRAPARVPEGLETLHGCLAAVAACQSDAVAVADGPRLLSYGELWTQARHLAWRLRRQGVGPEVRVGLCVERSLEMVVGLLGIIEAGGAYVPLDPRYPAQRLAYLLEDAGIEMLVTASSTPASVSSPSGRVVRIDESHAAPPPESIGSPAADARNAAYVIYTSGSTGKPKGVVVEHRQAVRLFTVCQPQFGFGSQDVWTLFHSYAFDFSVWEIWGALFFGGRLEIVSFANSRHPAAFWRLLERTRVTVLNQTPSAFDQLIAEGGPERAPSLRWVVFGGEALDPRRIESWLADRDREQPGPALVNMYGITETTVHVTFHRLAKAVAPARGASPIGKPLDDLCVRLLDASLRLVPHGVVGELHVGGAGLSRGYLGRPALTAQRFVPDPYGSRPGERLYRSGDLAFLDRTANLCFTGRADHQVKVRGFRIELGEIEAVMGREEDLAISRVLHDEATQRLVAYTVPRAGTDLDAMALRQLRRKLSLSLPEHMIPAAIVPMAALPLTPTGKLDRNALPKPTATAGSSRQQPKTPTEELLVSLWSEILEADGVATDQSFFELGGHSLLAIQVALRVRTAFGVELPVSDLFAAPTIEVLAARIEGLVRGAPAPSLPLRPLPADQRSELSFAQSRLWFIDRLEGSTPRYNIPFAIALEGVLKPAALAAALTAVEARHESLRTVFESTDSGPRQRLGRAPAVELTYIDLAGLGERSRERAAAAAAGSVAAQAFDLAAGPLWRASLLRLSHRQHRLLISIHHITADGWALDVMCKELTACYRAALHGLPPRLAPLVVQYADFAAWQRQILTDEALESSLAYWREQLRGAPALLELPADRRRPARPSYRGAGEPLVLDRDLHLALQKLSRAHHATLFMTFLAAFQALLSRLIGTRDLVVGTPIAGRTHERVEGLIGCFVNSLALRIDISGGGRHDMPFGTLLERVREVTLGAYAHQELPFERLVEELKPVRDLGRHPLFQVVLQSSRRLAPSLAGLRWGAPEPIIATTRFDLELHLQEGDTDHEPTGVLVYSPELFDRTTARRWSSSFRTLLRQAVDDPDRDLGDLSLLTPAQRHQMVTEWRGEAADYPANQGLIELFVEQANRRPDAVAWEMADEVVSYGALRRRAQALSCRLRRATGGTVVRVGLCIPRSAEMVIGMLAALGAGAAYVPLDPSHPDRRLVELMSDAGVDAVLARTRELRRLQRAWREHRPGASPPLLTVAGSPTFNTEPFARRGGSEPAYVIYTSGSTGRPKGVEVPQRSVARLVRASGLAEPKPGDRIAQATHITFDVSVFEIWGALLNGARLVGLSPQTLLSPRHLGAELTAKRVQALFLTPSHFHQVIRDEPRAFAGLSRLLLGGEAMDPVPVRELLRGAAPGRLLNGYGPTESGVFTTWHAVGEVPEGAVSVPIGRSLRNTWVQVVDAAFNTCALGAHGELCAGGPGLALSYVKRPALTGERFVPDPWSATPGERLYRTGDRVRRLADGRIDYLGRFDHQVKVRGFRIELGEIEAALAELPEVSSARVLHRAQSQQLVAYVVPVAGTPVVGTAGAALSRRLRQAVGQRLPGYMVPSVVVPLASLPRTLAGKLDHAALPVAPEATAAQRTERTPTEELLAGIWQEVLDVEVRGTDDSFFDLGGHSLLATQVASRVRGAFGVELVVGKLFTSPTLAALAAHIDRARRLGLRVAEPLLPTVSRRRAELSFAQQRLWFIDRLEGATPFYNIPFVQSLKGPLNVPALAAALAALEERHHVLRTIIEETGQGPVQRVVSARRAALPLIDLSGLSTLDRGTAARQGATTVALRPFDLERGPVWDYGLLKLGPGQHRLVVSLHHVAADGWSLGVLLQELAALYSLCRRDQAPRLPALEIQYSDFSTWQRRVLDEAALTPLLAYWREHLAAAPPFLELPTDRPRPARSSHRGEGVFFTLDRELPETLRELSQSHRVTLFMTVLATFQTLLFRLTNALDLIVGTPVAGRQRQEIEGLIGCFVNSLALRTRLSEEGGQRSLRFSELLTQVRDVALGAYAHQELPFERVIEELQPERDPGHHPLFQVSLTLHGTNAVLPASELLWEPLEHVTATTRFDLELHLLEDPAGGELGGALVYRRDLFDRSTIERWARCLSGLLRQAAEDPEQRLEAFEVLSAKEIRQLVTEPQPLSRSTRPATLHGLFAQRAAQQPDAVAVVDGSRQLTYGGLAARAGRLARRLRARSVGPEDRVGLCVERSAEMLVGLLAIVKAGAAYVPLDPHYPRQRLSLLLEDAGLGALVTTRDLHCSMPVSGVPILLLDGAASAHPPAPVSSPPVDGQHAAYVIYTSGSTGRPKGVVIEHRQAVRLFHSCQDAFNFGPADVWPLFHSYAFDFSVWEIWGALLYGGRLEVVPYWLSRSPTAFRDLLQHRRVTVLNQTPSAFDQLMTEGGPDELPVLRWVIFGGEALEPRRLRPWIEHESPRLVNMYGITETTVHVTCHPVRRAEPGPRGASPVGRPIPDLCIHLLDARLQLVLPGVTGEIYVAGAGLARGYLERPALTADRFVPNPFSSMPGERLYRSGDLACLGPDGELGHLGRGDHQVKVRGFRIELGEIETVLEAHPELALARVLHSPDSQQLVAYLVPRRARSPVAAALRQYLRDRLPDYMVPARFVQFEELPLTPTGKVDRAALEALTGPEEPEAGISPRTAVPASRSPIEALLAEIWHRELGLSEAELSPDADFFDLGGHSLLATRVLAGIRRFLGVELSLRALFEAPTLGALATRIERGRGEVPALPEPQAGVVTRRGPLSYAQERLWFLHQLEPGSALYNIPASWWLEGDLDIPALRRALAELVDRHGVLRTTYGPSPAGPVQRIGTSPHDRLTPARSIHEPEHRERKPHPAGPDHAPLPTPGTSTDPKLLRNGKQPPDGIPKGWASVASEHQAHEWTGLAPHVDLSALPAPDRQREMQRLARDEANRPFDLGAGPVFRTRLLRLEPRRHRLLLTLHHIAGDGGSLEILQHELSELYSACRRGEPSPFEAATFHYADFAHWQRGPEVSDSFGNLLAHWQRQLEGAPSLELPADRPRPAVTRYVGTTRRFRPRTGLGERLRQLGRTQGTTLFMSLLAAFDVLIYRWAGQRDISVGTPAANRDHDALAGSVGCFVNTLVLRDQLSPTESFSHLLAQVRETVLSGYEHRGLPFEKLVEALQPVRDLSRTPLFQTMFLLQPASAARAGETAGLVFRPRMGSTATSKLDLTLALSEVGGELSGAIEYRPDLFDATTIERLIRQLAALLEAIATEPEQRLDQLPLQSVAERHQLRVEWNDTATPGGTLAREVDRGGSIYQLFERQAARSPKAPAVIDDATGEVLSYTQLQRRARALAYRLRQAGVGAEARVGICLERSPRLVVGLLGILGAGAAYVPLDPDYPRERLAYMLADARVSVLLCDRRLSARLPSGTSWIDPAEPETQPDPPAEWALRARPESLAYVLYTSGSTGHPKGAMNSHRAVVNRLLWMQQAYGLTPDDRVVQKTPFSFDVSVWEFFWPLLAGAHLVLARPGGHRDSHYLVDLFRRQRITVAHFVPSMLRQFMATSGVEACAGLRCLIASGEALPADLARLCHQRSTADLHNLYGPTEAAIDVTAWPCRRGRSGPVPIGRPIANVRTRILGPSLEPIALGAPGELFLAGVALARGYHGRPALTAESFLPEIGGRDAGGRMYRTGDQARWRGDGAIEYLGRLDHQIKLRGVRIELGEIEAALGKHPGVTACAVLAAADASRLDACLVPATGANLDVVDLRRHLAETLPNAMIPARFISLEVLPVTPNGKLDRKALVALSATSAVLGADRGVGSGQAPTPTEDLLAGIWSEVLDLDSPPAPTDDFFALGGHSLLATQLMSRLGEILGCELPLRAVFEQPLLRGFARLVDQGRRNGHRMPRIEPAKTAGAWPLSLAQRRLWLLHHSQPPSAVYNIPLVLRLHGPIEYRALSSSLAEIARRHELLRATFVEYEGEPQARATQLAGTAGELGLADLMGLTPEARATVSDRLLCSVARRPFAFDRDPLLRAWLLRLDSTEHVLLLVLHHIVADGWSLRILLRELRQLYPAAIAGSATPLPPLPIRYADYARWQQTRLTDEFLAPQLAYWRQRLADVRPIDLPTDRPRPRTPTSAGGQSHRLLPPALTASLEAISRDRGATLFMALLAAFQGLLLRFGATPDLCIGTPVAGRGRSELEDLIGFFVNTLVLRAQSTRNPTPSALLTQARERALEAYDHQDVPFERLVEELGVERQPGRNPLFQVLFAWQADEPEPFEMGDLRAVPEEVATGTSKLDLTLVVSRRGGRLAATLEYSKALFDATTAERMLRGYGALLEGLQHAMETPISCLPLLPAATRHQLLVEWNDKRLLEPLTGTVHGLVARRAAERPESIAVSWGGADLSYAELRRRSQLLAARLAPHLRDGEPRVGIFLERSPELVIALLAVMETRAAYVPLDPAYPAERLATMAEDAGLSALVVAPDQRSRLPELAVPTVELGNQAPAKPAPWPVPPRPDHPDALAYVMYTSGSTGRPKGIGVSHRSILRLVQAPDYVDMSPEDTVAQASNASFDAATFELWGALGHGARLRGLTRDDTLEPARLARSLERHRVSVLFLTTALFDQVASTTPRAFGGLHTLLFGGQRVDAGAVRRVLRSSTPPKRLLHVYGPTETTTFASWLPVRAVAATARNVPIGGPLIETSLHVVDQGLRLLPPGARGGELVIGGPGVARGYLGRPALTAERFVPNPFAEPGVRLYRTGDVVGRRTDGAVEFEGRRDSQVKIRGLRIELGEIEAALCRHALVRSATVVAPEVATGERQLVAWVAAEAEGAPGRQLQAHLARRLPDYLVPARYIIGESLPLTANGKVDRGALERQALDLRRGQLTMGAPGEARTPTEELILGIFATVLGQDQEISLGRDDDFFALGGHSLLATRAVSRLRQAFGVELPLRALFESPTAATLAARVAAARGEGASRLPKLRPRTQASPLPLSFAQQRLWFLDRLEPQSAFYNIPLALRLTGPLNVAALAAALEAIAARHEALRTCFPALGGEPMQSIDDGSDLSLARVDLSALPAASRDHALADVLAQESSRPFDLGQGPLLRLVLVRLSATEHAISAVLHHIVADGWSLGIFASELRELYAAAVAGKPSILAPLSVQVADHALWQRSWLTGEILERQLAYWRRRLEGAPPLDLPTDRPRQANQNSAGGHRHLRLPTEGLEALTALSHRQGTTLFMTLLAAFQGLLVRFGATPDLCIGTPVAGRGRSELEDLIGFFVNTLVLRAECARNPTPSALLSQARERALEAYDHQDVPFERLVEKLGVERQPGRNPLFQVLFAWQADELEPFEMGDVRAAPEDVATGTSKLDLTLVVSRRGGRLAATLEYSKALFDATTAERMLRGYGALLEGFQESTETPISRLPLLPAAARHQLLVEWNDKRRPEPLTGTVHGLVARRAAERPESIAVSWGSADLSYAELRRRSQLLAARLGPHLRADEPRVGIFLERSPELVIALLAVLEARAAYVPLDPAYPAERLATMAEDAGLSALVTTPELRPRLPELAVPTVELDQPASATHAPQSVPPRSVHPHALAYVMYTSGSTGRPKGIGVSHRSILRLVQAPDYVDLSPEDTLAQASNASFDAATFELWGALGHGARLQGLRRDDTLEPARLARALERHRVSVLFLTTALFDQVASTSPRAFGGLRTLLFGGQRVVAAAVQQVLTSSAPPGRLLHVYGPTETTTFASWQPIRAVAATARNVPIGGPLIETSLHVVDQGLRLLPPGARGGELVIGGPGVARGYLGRPTLTAERFVPDPFAEPGARLYRTGDVVQRKTDGAVEFEGRRDSQVKIRGLRIELGEIEAVLSGHAMVRSATVVAPKAAAGERQLVAWVTAETEGIEARQLQAYLARRLPDYMVPTRFVVGESLPLTTNGKVDRGALERQAMDLRRGQLTLAAPGEARTPAEELILGIFATVLGQDQETTLGRDDDFFALGGHSLLATRAVSRLRQAFGVELPLRALFESPTAATLATRVTTARGDGGPRVPKLRPRTQAAPLPLSFAQQRLWFLDRLEPQSAFYNIPLALRLTGPLNVAALAAALEAIVDRHEVLRTCFPTRDGEPVQRVGDGSDLGLALVDLSGLPATHRDHALAGVLAREGSKPFDLDRGPLLRLVLVRLSATEHALSVVLHHIAADGWSLAIFASELRELYAAAAAGKPPILAPLPVQVADHALWQRSWLTGEVLDHQLAYWRQRLEGAPPLELPTDRPRQSRQTHRGATRAFMLPRELKRRLAELGHEHGATLFMILLAAFHALLHRLSGQRDLCVGSPIANRQRPELEPLIGFFVNTLVMRSHLSDTAPTALELLRQARQESLGAYAHQDVPFERLVEALDVERDLGRTPLFQVMLAVQNLPTAEPWLEGLEVRQMDLEVHTAKFDLLLAMREGDDEAGFEGALEYNLDLFDGVTIERLISAWQTLLTAFPEALERSIWELPLLTTAASHQMLTEWNDTAAPGIARGGLLAHQMFEAQAARTPRMPAVALTTGDSVTRMTYGELESRSRRLARCLASAGVGPDARVGLCIERSLALAVGALAILRAGGAYVPLDPDYPEERLRFMLKNAGFSALLTRQRWLGLLPVPSGVPVLCVDALGATETSSPTTTSTDLTPPAAPNEDHLAYVIYTSGSTGQPKGVAMPHGPLANLVRWQTQRSPSRPGRRTAQFASISFDVAFQEMFSTWAVGGTLMMVNDDQRRDARALIDLLNGQAIERLFLPPVAFQQLAEVARAEGILPLSLREITTAGEQLVLTPAVRELLDKLADCRLENQYGPSETHVVSAHPVKLPAAAEPPGWALTPAIGRPILGARLSVLGPQFEPVPVGSPGEIYLGGHCLARGYHQRPAATAERFVPDPLASAVGARIYRTGDRARVDAGGEVRFLGRVDGQLKVRGYRVEPGEIEAALQRHSTVRSAVVDLRGGEKDGSATPRLVAYVIPEDGLEPDSALLRGHLQASLPDYMIPAAFVVLETWPLTPSGKLDRRGLPAPERQRNDDLDAWVAPRNQAEWELVRIWEELLEVRPVGVRDDFFALGGHSLLGVRLMAHIRGRLGRELPLAQLFETPTIEGLAMAVENGEARLGPPLVTLRAAGTRPPLYCIHPGGGNVLCYRQLAEHLGEDQPFFALQARGVETADPPRTDVESMARAYTAALLEDRPEGPYQLAGWSFGGLVAFDMARRLQAAGHEVRRLVLFDTVAPHDDPVPVDDFEILAHVAGILGIPARPDRLRELGHEAALRHVGGKAARASLLPAGSGEYLKRHLAVFQAAVQAASRYRPAVYDGETHLFHARDREPLLDHHPLMKDPALGWSPHTNGSLTIHHVAGFHVQLMGVPYVEPLAKILRQVLS